MKFDAVHINSAPELLVKEIIKQIQAGHLTPGDALPSQRALAKMFKVGLGSVREAIKILNVMGYLHVIRGKGTYISETALDTKAHPSKLEKAFEVVSLAELMKAREILECEAAAMASQEGDKEAIAQLRHIGEQMDFNNKNTNFYYRTDFNFHMAVADATHNKAIIELLKILVDKAHEHVGLMDDSLSISMPPNAHTAIITAKNVIEAIAAGDGAKARKEMLDHLNIVKANLHNEFPGTTPIKKI
ncbi:DNA-binding transcriptional regulator, FadR family [Desulfocicer vacuolatum DSM 3385]|uniref:DNA-binding transcriptional regulator, FadR family n=1 Tax=Desulfocicer vacuolatum DSM 3385 TaxID=1121400 RepID=A0A1W2D9J4_9BACT|nr:FadR/GntR family transcriptional regulator [Desulfocicer vacuolatum]SMC94111.1 DNA-binding transcriptional regulator, FadR family [Desulfocicer vacuolatum DSM 3385]